MRVNYKLIGKRIKKERIKRGFTQENIAEHLDISVSYVSRVERAAVKVSLETLVRIAAFLGVKTSFLIEGAVAISDDYLQGELAEVIKGFDSDKMKLLLEIAQSIKNFTSNSHSNNLN